MPRTVDKLNGLASNDAMTQCRHGMYISTALLPSSDEILMQLRLGAAGTDTESNNFSLQITTYLLARVPSHSTKKRNEQKT